MPLTRTKQTANGAGACRLDRPVGRLPANAQKPHNKMHPECLAMHQADAEKYGDREWEYSPYSHERPKVEA